MKDRKGFRIVLTAMLAAMVCVSTICIQIASRVGGYINLGDALVLMSGFMLGPVYGGAAAGIGSALADIITGYAYYAPGTLVIKAAIAAVAALLARSLARRAPHGPSAALGAGGNPRENHHGGGLSLLRLALSGLRPRRCGLRSGQPCAGRCGPRDRRPAHTPALPKP